LSASVNGARVSLQWTPLAGAQEYHLQVGLTPGGTAIEGYLSTPFLIIDAPQGIYYVRVRGVANGRSVFGPFSNEVVVNVSGSCALPVAPLVTLTQNQDTIDLSWNQVPGATYQVVWSRTPGGADLVDTTAATSARRAVGLVGTFFARVVAVTPCGSATSNEVSFTIASLGAGDPATWTSAQWQAFLRDIITRKGLTLVNQAALNATLAEVQAVGASWQWSASGLRGRLFVPRGGGCPTPASVHLRYSSAWECVYGKYIDVADRWDIPWFSYWWPTF
jgi:hypothetical protein